MKKKILFIYRSGTFLEGIPINYTLNKLVTYLSRITSELYYELVFVINPIGFGTEVFPRVHFNEPHKFIIRSFEDEGIYVSSVSLILSKETSNTDFKLLSNYLSKSYNRSHPFVRGDSLILLPKNLGNQYLWINKLNRYLTIVGLQALQLVPWKQIYNLLKYYLSESSYRRRSKETDIQIFIKIDGKGISYIHTGFGFFDHMIDQICIHSNIDLGLKVKGDLHLDEHHIMEDIAITLGIALSKAIKDKRGIARYGFLLPMDDILAQVAIDLGGRSNLIWKAFFEREKIGDVPTEMFVHFFKSFSDVAYCNLNIKAEGINEHHKIEAIFKAFAYAIKMASYRNHDKDRVPSTKEIL